MGNRHGMDCNDLDCSPYASLRQFLDVFEHRSNSSPLLLPSPLKAKYRPRPQYHSPETFFMAHLLGIDPHAEVRDALNRPFPISSGSVIEGVLA